MPIRAPLPSEPTRSSHQPSGNDTNQPQLILEKNSLLYLDTGDQIEGGEPLKTGSSSVLTVLATPRHLVSSRSCSWSSVDACWGEGSCWSLGRQPAVCCAPPAPRPAARVPRAGLGSELSPLERRASLTLSACLLSSWLWGQGLHRQSCCPERVLSPQTQLLCLSSLLFAKSGHN